MEPRGDSERARGRSDPAGDQSSSQSPQPIARRLGRDVYAVAAAGMLVALLVVTPAAHDAWQELTQFLTLQGKPEPASASVLSEHELEALDRMAPQAQAQLLLERSINHYRGANEQ